jgi:hypothetical protein
MNAEQQSLDDDISSPPSPRPISPVRQWLERIGIGLIAIISLLIPLVIGLLYYLALTDGIVINANDPLHETRLWMVHERKGATGLGLTITSPQSSSSAQATCAHTAVTFLKWDGALRIESEAGYCRCYAAQNGQWIEAPNGTCQ